MFKSVSKGLLASRYRVHQRMNEQLLRSELEAIEEVIGDSRVRAIQEDAGTRLVQEKAVEKARRMMGISRDRRVNPDKVRQYSNGAMDSASTQTEWDTTLSDKPTSSGWKVDRLSQYESRRGYPAYQDLTHVEARRVQELFEKRKMLNRKIQWLKNNQIVDPVRQVDKEMRIKEREEYFKSSDAMASGTIMYPPPFSNEVDPVMDKRVSQLEIKMERDTKISRLRTELRKQKLENSHVMKTASPAVGHIQTDPLKRHLQRRRVRVALLLQQYLEEFLSCNSAQIILDHLGGAAVSIERVTAPSTRGVHDVYVRVTSDHDKNWVQKQLDILTPKLRSQLAVRVNYGYTPELKFHVIDDVSKFNKGRLMKLASDAKRDVDMSIHQHFMKEMNWK